MTYDDACRVIVDSPTANDYAKAYARAGTGMQGHEAEVQALYILNNITHWRAPEAKEVRAALRNMKVSA